MQFYIDGKTLRENCGKLLKDFKSIVVQRFVRMRTAAQLRRASLTLRRTPVPESLTADHLLLYVHQWHPAEFKLGPQLEVHLSGLCQHSHDARHHQMAFEKTLLMSEFKAKLGSLADIPTVRLSWPKNKQAIRVLLRCLHTVFLWPGSYIPVANRLLPRSTSVS